MFTLRLFGGAALEGPDGPLHGRVCQRRRLALLALMAAEHPRAVSRDKLIAYLWPESDTDQARHLLRDSLYVLRSGLGERAVLTAGDEVRLNPDQLICDLWEFDGALARDEPEPAASVYAGAFLDGFFLSDADEFERWAEVERQRIATRYLQALERLAERGEARGESVVAAQWWSKLAVEDPGNSRIALRYIRALEAAGDRAGALRHADQHNVLLRTEFGTSPTAEIIAFAKRLQEESAFEPTFVKRNLIGQTRAGQNERAAQNPSSNGGANPLSLTNGPFVETDGPDVRDLPSPSFLRPFAGRQSSLFSWKVVAAALVVFVALIPPLWLRGGDNLFDAKRVVVAPFENHTGDPSLEPLGLLAADWVTEGIHRIGEVEVISARASLAAVPEHGAGKRAWRGLAHELGAHMVITAAYYRVGDSLRIQAQINDVRRRHVVAAIKPVNASSQAPTAAIALLSQRITGALAPSLDQRLPIQAQVISQPPSYEAYREYVEGMEALISGRTEVGLAHFEKAVALDSTYLPAKQKIGWALLNLGRFAAVDSIVSELQRVASLFSPFERATLDLLTTLVSDDPVAQYEAAARVVTVAPGSLPHVRFGNNALLLNRPREALRILLQIDPTRGEMRGYSSYWIRLTEARHALGDHRREFKDAHSARILHPGDPWYFVPEARALAALGRTAELQKLVNYRLSLPEQRGPISGRVMRAAADELRVHGHAHDASVMYDRAIAWYRARASATWADREDFALALIGRDHLHAAQALLRQNLEQDWLRISTHGLLGLLAARLGRRAEAERIAGQLPPPVHPSLNGEVPRWRACIFAHLGRSAEALALLAEAAGKARRFPHEHPCLDPLRDDPAFREWWRPKG